MRLESSAQALGSRAAWEPGGSRIAAADRDALQRNIVLAESLGATVVRVKADRPADGLIEFAKREGITHVIFGQTARSRWEILLKGSTLNRFLEEVRDAAGRSFQWANRTRDARALP